MTNTPKKIMDPTEAALSAIQDALSARDAAAEPQTPVPPATPPEEPASEWRTIRSTTLDADVPPPEEQSLPRRAANDDRESIGQILRTLQRRPARTSYFTATVFAGLWVLAGLLLVMYVVVLLIVAAAR